jgi:hypothetical protein
MGLAGHELRSVISASGDLWAVLKESITAPILVEITLQSIATGR